MDGKSAVLVEERNTHELAEAILEVATAPQIWLPMGKAGRDHIEKHFDIVEQVRLLEIIYDGVTGAR